MQRIRAGGISTEYAEAGPRNGPPVLLIHGLGWDARRLWGGTLKALAGEGFRAVAPNLRGVGGTDATDAAYTTHMYAADLDAFLEALGIGQTSIVGFSMGASIATAMLAGRGAARIGPVVLACGGTFGTKADEASTEAFLVRAEALGVESFAAEQADAVFRREWAEAHPEEVDDFKNWRARMNQPALMRAFRSGFGIDLTGVVARSERPTQVIAATEDAFFPLDDLRALAHSIPGATLDVIEASGHMAPIEQPAAFEAALLRFLRTQWAPT